MIIYHSFHDLQHLAGMCISICHCVPGSSGQNSLQPWLWGPVTTASSHLL